MQLIRRKSLVKIIGGSMLISLIGIGIICSTSCGGSDSISFSVTTFKVGIPTDVVVKSGNKVVALIGWRSNNTSIATTGMDFSGYLQITGQSVGSTTIDVQYSLSFTNYSNIKDANIQIWVTY